MSLFGCGAWDCVSLLLLLSVVFSAAGAELSPPAAFRHRQATPPSASVFVPVWNTSLPGQLPPFFYFPAVIRDDPLVFSAPPFLTGMSASTGAILYNSPIASGIDVIGVNGTVVVTGGTPSFKPSTATPGSRCGIRMRAWMVISTVSSLQRRRCSTAVTMAPT